MKQKFENIFWVTNANIEWIYKWLIGISNLNTFQVSPSLSVLKRRAITSDNAEIMQVIKHKIARLFFGHKY